MAILFIRQRKGPLVKEWSACRPRGKAFYCEPNNLQDMVRILLHSNNTLAGDVCIPLGPEEWIPFGSVQFVQEYCKQTHVTLPNNFSYGTHPGQLDRFLTRTIRRGRYSDAMNNEFIKPVQLKLFDATVKADAKLSIDLIERDPHVWISELVDFGAEFRFYIHNGVIMGWCRYDEYDETYPDPDIVLAQQIVDEVSMTSIPVPIAYSVDIGYRKDLDRYCLVEMNDFWSLGWYNFRDAQSRPITEDQYAQAVIDRWLQIAKPVGQ